MSTVEEFNRRGTHDTDGIHEDPDYIVVVEEHPQTASFGSKLMGSHIRSNIMNSLRSFGKSADGSRAPGQLPSEEKNKAVNIEKKSTNASSEMDLEKGEGCGDAISSVNR